MSRACLGDLSELGGLRLALFTGGYACSVLASEHLYGSLAVPSPFWFPDAVLLSALVLAPPRWWWIFITLIWPIRVVIGAPAGTPLWFLLVFTGNDALKALAAAWLLRRVVRRPLRLDALGEFMIFLGIAAAAVPLLSALAAMPWRHALGNTRWDAVYHWWLGNALAQVVVTPTILYWATRRHGRTGSPVETLVLCSALTVAVYYGFVVRHGAYSPSLLYAPVPFLLWAAVRLRPFGTANAIASVTVVAMLSAVNGTGAFAGTNADQNIVSIQLFLLVVGVSLLSLAILVTERERRTRDLEAVLDAAPMTILIATDPACTHILANRTGYTTHRLASGVNLAREAEAAGSRPFRLMRNGVDIPTADLPLQRAVRSGRIVCDDELTLVLDDGTERHLIGNAAPLVDDDNRPRGAVGAFLDVTDHKLAERALRESEGRFHLVADTAPVLIWMADAGRSCTFVNKGWLDFTGRSLEQELGDGWSSSVHPDDVERCAVSYAHAFGNRVPFDMEYRRLRHDGEYRWMADRGVPRFDPDGALRGYIGSCIDITERKQVERRLQHLSGRLLQAQEQERARIARDLHDDFGQRMALMQIELQRFGQTAVALDDTSRRQLRSIGETAARMASELHDLSHQLHPSTLEALGLVPALRGLCMEFAGQHALEIQFRHHDVPVDVAREVSMCVFRITQEALRNVLKHSAVAEATVELSCDNDWLDLTVADKGAGFDVGAERRKAGLGLVSIRERLRPIGGQLSIESAPSRGTRVSVRVPVRM